MSSNATQAPNPKQFQLLAAHSTQVKRSITKLYFISSVMLTRQSIKYPVLVAIHCPYRCSYCMALHCMAAHRIASHRTASHLGKSGSGRKGMFLLGFCNCLFLLLSVVQRLNTINNCCRLDKRWAGLNIQPGWESCVPSLSLERQRKGRENTTTPPG